MSEQAENKELVTKYFEACGRADARQISDMYAPDGVHVAMGKTLISGTYKSEQMYNVAAEVVGAFPEGLKFTVGQMVAEGDTVAVEVETQGMHVSGAEYNNKYAFFMRFRKGLILSVKEYFDTEHVTDVLFGGKDPTSEL